MRRFKVHLVTEVDFEDGDEASDKDTVVSAARGLLLRTIKGSRIETVSVTEIKDEL